MKQIEVVQTDRWSKGPLGLVFVPIDWDSRQWSGMRYRLLLRAAVDHFQVSLDLNVDVVLVRLAPTIHDGPAQ